MRVVVNWYKECNVSHSGDDPVLWESIHSLVLQCFLIMVPIIIYKLHPQSAAVLRHRHGFDVLLAVTLLLSMTFPVRFIEGNVWDLREVPMIIGTLYGGPVTGIVLFTVFSIYRFLLGGIGTYGALFINGLMMMALFILYRKFHCLQKPQRVLVATSVSLGAVLVLLFYTTVLFHYGSAMFFIITGLLTLVQTGSVAFITYLVETFDVMLVVQQQLEQEQHDKYRLLSAISASVAHEIRNPLTVIKGFLQLLEGTELSVDKQKEYIHYCLAELQQSESVIEDYLVLAYPEQGPHVILHLKQELQYIYDVIQPLALMNQVEVILTVDASVSLYGIQDHIRLSLINLCKNAVESMPFGGVLKVSATSGPNEVVIQITDTGCGMTEEQVSRLGTPHYLTGTKGTGLGTTLTYRIIESMGGHIKCRSVLGQGTSFIIQLPKSGPSAVVYSPA